ncbi:MAG: murein biosynthesis integral membrane protein MurJ [Planctomycetes bacterium]|nr:murein biosynthesis integral membrane protein MurJ [Planctomycetota bacterium]
MSRLVRAATSISVITLLSRILGLVRDRLMAQTLGAGWVQGTFLLAWMLPNLMRRLLGEGALSASLVPRYAKLRKHDPAAAKRLLEDVSGTVITILTPVCALVAIASLLVPSEWLPTPDEGGPESIRLLLALNAILFVYALPVCLAAVGTGALNTFGVFALPASIPVALNIIWIAALVAAKPLGFEVDTEIATFAAWCLMVGGFVQLVMVLAPLWRRRELGRPRLGLPQRGTAAFAVFVAMGPTVLGMSLNQISSLVDQLLAYYLIAPGANTYVYLANRLLLFPHALTAMAVAVAVFPKLASEADEVDRGQMRGTLDRAAAATILVTLPASMGLIVLANDVVDVLFVGGRFGGDDVAPTVLTTSCLVAGLPFLGLAQLYARAFYAVGDTATPARTAARLVLVNVTISVTLLLATGLGTAALTLASSITSLGNAAILSRRFRRHADARSGLGRAWLRSLVATAAMCATLPFLRFAGDDASLLARALGNLALPIGVGMLVYLLAHVLMRSPELRALRRPRA